MRNEEKYIAQCLAALVAQDYPAELLEILVVDGMSDDRSAEVVAEWTEQHPNVRLLKNEKRQTPAGLNVGILAASGAVIARIDAHCEIEPDYISQCVRYLERTGADNVGGLMRPVGDTYWGQAIALSTSTPFGVGDSRFHYSEKEEFVDTVYLGAWPIHVFKKIGLFDEELVRDQDDEFNYRLRSSGGRILLSPKINSSYTVRSSPLSLWRQYFQYGFWKVRVLQKHPKQMSLRQFVPFLFVSAITLSLILTLLFNWGWVFLVSLVGFYLASNLLASVLTFNKYRLEKELLSFLPLAFSIIHIGYGCGFLLGLFRFLNRWKDRTGIVPGY